MASARLMLDPPEMFSTVPVPAGTSGGGHVGRDHVVDEGEVADLDAVAVEREGLAGHDRLAQPVERHVGALTGAVDGEVAQRHGRDRPGRRRTGSRGARRPAWSRRRGSVVGAGRTRAVGYRSASPYTDELEAYTNLVRRASRQASSSRWVASTLHES